MLEVKKKQDFQMKTYFKRESYINQITHTSKKKNLMITHCSICLLRSSAYLKSKKKKKYKNKNDNLILFSLLEVDIAQTNGAAGILMYTDPAEFTGMKGGDDRVYPSTWWLPPDGVQRGTVFTGEGDPLTPGYPANGKR